MTKYQKLVTFDNPDNKCTVKFYFKKMTANFFLPITSLIKNPFFFVTHLICQYLNYLRGRLPSSEELLTNEDVVKLKRCIYASQVI